MARPISNSLLKEGAGANYDTALGGVIFVTAASSSTVVVQDKTRERPNPYSDSSMASGATLQSLLILYHVHENSTKWGYFHYVYKTGQATQVKGL